MAEVKVRRKPATYGKRKINKTSDPFNFLVPENDYKSLQSQKVFDSALSSDLVEVPRRIYTTDNVQQSPQRLPDAAGQTSSSESSQISRHVRDGSNTSSIFDAPLSDDEDNHNRSPESSQKRRKITPLAQKKRRSASIVAGSMQVTRIGVYGKKEDAPSSDDIRAFQQKHEQTAKIQRSAGIPRMQMGKHRKDVPLPREPAVVQIPEEVDDDLLVTVVISASSPSPPQTPVSKASSRQRNSISPSVQLRDQLYKSLTPPDQVANHKRVLSDVYSDIDVASPSYLAMKSLRLTPELGSSVQIDSHIHPESFRACKTTLDGARGRRVKDLDSPQKQSQMRLIPSDNAYSTKREPSTRPGLPKTLSRSISQVSVQESSGGPRPTFERSDNQIPLIPQKDTKITYAKERSHLSDMVMEDLIVPLSASFATTVQEMKVPTKSNICSSFTSQSSSQNEIEDVDEDAGTAIRSIHELRQAGLIARFQGSLEALFEDIEQTGRGANSGRLRALIQLAQKFQVPAFAYQFLESRMDRRFAACLQHPTNLLSATLVSYIYAMMLKQTQPGLETLQLACGVLSRTSKQLLNEIRTLPRFVKAIGKDRKENLSGSMCKDILDFFHTAFDSSFWLGHDSDLITAQLVALNSLEPCIRGIREHKDFRTLIPASLVEEMVIILEHWTEGALDSKADSTTILELTMSIMEYATLSHGGLEKTFAKAFSRLSVIGPLLHKLNIVSESRAQSIERLALRLLLNVSNNKPSICEVLGRTALIPAVAGIIRKDFVMLCACADADKDLDEARLESVILALGSLINFAECSESSRNTMYDVRNDEGGFADWLVSTFNTRSGKVSEAASLEQTHALVAFGYLSMLLCALCIDSGIRDTVRRKLTGASLNQLLLAAEEFLEHFRTVESVIVEEETSTNFTERFGAIIVGLKEVDMVA